MQNKDSFESLQSNAYEQQSEPTPPNPNADFGMPPEREAVRQNAQGDLLDERGRKLKKRWSEMNPQERKREVWLTIRLIIIVFVIGMLLRNFVIQRNTVRGSSMYPTLQNGDELIVEKVSRYFHAIHRGDIVTIDVGSIAPRDQEHYIIKRVVGLPGEEVWIKNGRVWINGKVLPEPYLPPGTETDVLDPRFARVKLGVNQYYVLGDNRGGSSDSRYYGPMQENWFLGHLLFRFLPIQHFGVPK